MRAIRSVGLLVHATRTKCGDYRQGTGMKKGEWTFVSNHARLLAYVAKHRTASAQEMAFATGLSMRAVSQIITDLRDGGYVSWTRMGRRNHYTVHADRPMRHPLERRYQVGRVLAAIGVDGHKCAEKTERPAEEAGFAVSSLRR
jgi:hypothetical protein